MRISKTEMDRLNAFDKAAERAGGYIDRSAASAPSYHIRNMHKWCITHNRTVESLTPEEREKFRTTDSAKNKAL